MSVKRNVSVCVATTYEICRPRVLLSRMGASPTTGVPGAAGLPGGLRTFRLPARTLVRLQPHGYPWAHIVITDISLVLSDDLESRSQVRKFAKAEILIEWAIPSHVTKSGQRHCLETLRSRPFASLCDKRPPETASLHRRNYRQLPDMGCTVDDLDRDEPNWGFACDEHHGRGRKVLFAAIVLERAHAEAGEHRVGFGLDPSKPREVRSGCDADRDLGPGSRHDCSFSRASLARHLIDTGES